MFTRFVLPVLVLTVVIATGYWIVLSTRKWIVRRRLTSQLRLLDHRYLEFVADRELLADQRNESLESLSESLVKEAAPILKPEIDALLDQLDQANQGLLPVALPSVIFPNVLAAYRSLDGADPLTDAERAQFRSAMAEAVRADVHQRLLFLQTDSQI